LREAPKVQLANTERVVWCSRRNNAACQYAIEKLPEDLQTAIGKRMSFADPAPDNSDRAIPYEIRDYPELMDWSGLAVVEGKCAGIGANLPSAGFLADMAVVVIAVCYSGQAATRGAYPNRSPGRSRASDQPLFIMFLTAPTIAITTPPPTPPPAT